MSEQGAKDGAIQKNDVEIADFLLSHGYTLVSDVQQSLSATFMSPGYWVGTETRLVTFLMPAPPEEEAWRIEGPYDGSLYEPVPKKLVFHGLKGDGPDVRIDIKCPNGLVKPFDLNQMAGGSWSKEISPGNLNPMWADFPNGDYQIRLYETDGVAAFERDVHFFAVAINGNPTWRIDGPAEGREGFFVLGFDEIPTQVVAHGRKTEGVAGGLQIEFEDGTTNWIGLPLASGEWKQEINPADIKREWKEFPAGTYKLRLYQGTPMDGVNKDEHHFSMSGE